MTTVLVARLTSAPFTTVPGRSQLWAGVLNGNEPTEIRQATEGLEPLDDLVYYGYRQRGGHNMGLRRYN